MRSSMEPKWAARSLRGALADEADAEAEEDAGEREQALRVGDLVEQGLGGFVAYAVQGDELSLW